MGYDFNNLEELDLSNNSELTYLECKNNDIKILNIPNTNNLDIFEYDEDKVHVIAKTVTAIQLNNNEVSLEKDQTTQLTATVVPADADITKVKWTSSDETVATVDENGLVTAVSEGTAVITVSATDFSGVLADCIIKVVAEDLGSTGDVEVKNYPAVNISYRTHIQTFGWEGTANDIKTWKSNGTMSGTSGKSKRLEGIQIVVVKKGESFNQKMGDITSAKTEAFVAKEGNSPIVNYPATSNTNPVVPGADTVNVVYRTHVQSFGWQGWKYNGQMSGTSGKSKRLEGINIELRNKDCSGDIVYTTHVQKYGWQGKLEDQSTWKKNGEMAGTSGEAKRLEAICINLTGEMCQKYDIYYRVHAQSYGWLGWAKNGAPAGTAGYAKRLEGIQVVLVPKGGAAPTSHDGITSARAEAYIKK